MHNHMYVKTMTQLYKLKMQKAVQTVVILYDRTFGVGNISPQQ